MASANRLAALDLHDAFDFAIMIEEDAEQRYRALARRVGKRAHVVRRVCRAMARAEAQHRLTLLARRQELFKDLPSRIDVSVLDEQIEGPELELDEAPHTGREALELARAAELRAKAFYEEVLELAIDPEAAELFRQLALEEVDHAALLERQIAQLPPDGEVLPALAQPVFTAPVAEEPFASLPDGPLLLEHLARFDLATQAVARSAIADGVPTAELAAKLGVSRSTVARKLSRFLALARQQVASSAVVVALASCAVPLPHLKGSAALSTGEPLELLTAADAVCLQKMQVPPSPPAESRLPVGAFAARIHAQVLARMAAHSPEVRTRVAQTVLSEAERAKVDPVLVLAVIEVESSFNPDAISSAGAVGLMQLMEPTMNEIATRHGLPAERNDPVANVRVGVRYLRWLLDFFGGDLEEALMAYNAGPNRIRSQLDAGNVPEQFRSYSRKVMVEMERLKLALAPRSRV